MGKATGAFLILAGIGTAALVLPAIDKDAERQLSEVVRIATGATAPAIPAIQHAAQSSARPTASVAARPAAKPATTGLVEKNSIAAASVHSSASPPADLVPAIAASTIKPVVQPAAGEVQHSAVSDTKSATLTRDIQRELKRVGCYDGELSGDWNSATKKAMRAFVERVNATLPVETPDHILKTLVQGHPGAACGATCPSGQSLNNDGRCMPIAILAQRDGGLLKKRTVAAANLPAPTKPQEKILEKPAETIQTTKSWTTTVETAATTLPIVTPLPGRMAIGAPKSEVNAPASVSPPVAAALQPSPPQRPRQTSALPSDDAEIETQPSAGKRPVAAPRTEEPRRAERRNSVPVAVFRAPPPVKYAAPSWSRPVRRFGPHIFSEQARWGR